MPLCQKESLCKTIVMNMCFICIFIFKCKSLIFTRKVLHLDSFWNRGKRQPAMVYKRLCTRCLLVSFMYTLFTCFSELQPKYYKPLLVVKSNCFNNDNKSRSRLAYFQSHSGERHCKLASQCTVWKKYCFGIKTFSAHKDRHGKV